MVPMKISSLYTRIVDGRTEQLLSHFCKDLTDVWTKLLRTKRHLGESKGYSEACVWTWSDRRYLRDALPFLDYKAKVVFIEDCILKCLRRC